MFDTKSTQRIGNDGYIWFTGVVEDIDDPLQLGRLRVRILGDHTQSTKNIPTDSLPWAYLMNSPLSSSMQGIGDSPTGMYVKGAWVKGFYWDGIDKQQPVITHSFGGIPESIPFNPKKDDNTDIDSEDLGPACGFQDPDKTFPMGHAIFEQDTNRLAKNSPSDHSFEIPEALVPPQEKMIQEALYCPKKPVYGKEHYDTFDEAYVRKFAQGEDKKDADDDSVVDGETQSQTDLKVEDKKDETCQYFLDTNNHPFTVYKFINRERFIPKGKVFADPMHREYWHEPDNKWATKYPYNKVWEGYHEVGETTVENPGNQFVSEAYGYDKTIENYDGSDKEGLYRKQKCGIGSWGLGEEWDSTPGNNRYHRFTPSGNYLEIDHSGNEVRKIYGDSFEIDLNDRTLLVKGDWHVTVEGDQNVLVEGDRNIQVMGDLQTDVRGDIKTHCDGDHELHVKDNERVRVDGDQRVRIGGSRETTICVDDYVESQTTEMRADEIVRKGGKSMIDEAFKKYELKAYDMEGKICNVSLDVNSWEERVGVLNSSVSDITESYLNHTEKHETHTEHALNYSGCIETWFLNTIDYTLIYEGIYLVQQGAFSCELDVGDIEVPDVGTANYPETDGISQCLVKYNESINKAKANCTTTLIDPRTLEDYTRFDWEKYHASIDSAKKSYEACVAANVGKECGVCAPEPGTLEWNCEGCHDPDCPAEDKEYEFYNCNCECDGPKEEVFIDPWLECSQEKP